MSAEKGNISDVWGFFGRESRQAKLAEQYCRYTQEMMNLERNMARSATRSPTREARLKDLTNRLVPQLQAQLEN